MEGQARGNIVDIRVIFLVLQIEVPCDWLSHHAKIVLKTLCVGLQRSNGGGARHEKAKMERIRVLHRDRGWRRDPSNVSAASADPDSSGLTMSLLSSPSPSLQATRDTHARQCRGPGPAIHGLHTHLLLPGGLLPQGWLRAPYLQS